LVLAGQIVQEIGEGKNYMPCLLETGPSYCDLAVMMTVTAKATSRKAVNMEGKRY